MATAYGAVTRTDHPYRGMRPFTPAWYKAHCARMRLRPFGSYGQHFLIDLRFARQMCDAAAISNGDTVLEVGPGFGPLTVELARRAGRVIAVEADKKLAAYLREAMRHHRNVEVVEGDFLRQFASLPIHKITNSYKVVANLPYSITSETLILLCAPGDSRPSCIALMLQKEVVQRITARPGEMSPLAVLVQYFGKAELVTIVPRSAFWPTPTVESAIVRIHLLPPRYGLPPHDEARLFTLVRAGFSRRRRTLANNLASALKCTAGEIAARLGHAGINPRARAQELGVDEWVRLAALCRT